MITTISPITNKPVFETPSISVDLAVDLAKKAAVAQKQWNRVGLPERKKRVAALLDLLEKNAVDLGTKLTTQMGRPIQYTPGEVSTAVQRGRVLLEYADEALCRVDVDKAARPKFTKYLTREARGVVLIIYPWNYPYLTLINSLVPALLAGDAPLLKPSPQTPQTADAVATLAAEAGIPSHVITPIHSGNAEVVNALITSPIVQAISFTGSVQGGLAVQQAAAKRTIPVALELGGNDAAYVRADVDVPAVADAIADGALFNSGQSCCSVERVYVDRKIYDQFVDEVVKTVTKYKVGDPREEGVVMGPMVSQAAAERVHAAVKDAVEKGAKSLVPSGKHIGPTYVYPQVLVDVPSDHELLVEETFGPVLPIAPVSDDEEAIDLINDSRYGLTASVWTNDEERGEEIADRLDAGTVFVNRCDYPDPHLAWTGYRDSGRGVSLSPFGFDFWVKIKSHHIKKHQ